MNKFYTVFIALSLCAKSYASLDSLSTDSLDLSWNLAIDSIEKSLQYQTGVIDLGDGMASITIPEGFGFLDPVQASYVLEELWGNPPTETYGLLVPTGHGVLQDNSWAFEISFDEMGYVKDEDADDINYEDLLTEMQSDTKLASDERVKLGYEEVALVNWASTPFYDKTNKVLHWAKELKFGVDSLNTLNYNIRILGRKGVMVVNAIGGINMLNEIKPAIDPVMHSVKFADGHRYEDFDSNIDEVAAYTVGGLVAGKVLAKAGILALILKFGKFILLGILAGGGIIWKFITGRKKKAQEGLVPIDNSTPHSPQV